MIWRKTRKAASCVVTAYVMAFGTEPTPVLLKSLQSREKENYDTNRINHHPPGYDPLRLVR